MHENEFKYLKDYESRIEALIKVSENELEIWADLPAHRNDRIRETSGDAIPIRLFRLGRQ